MRFDYTASLGGTEEARVYPGGRRVNSAIEIHDSKLAAVIPSAEGLIVRLDPAYVHRSEGRPGVDAGTGWCQPAEMVFASGVVEGELPELPWILGEGRISGGANFREMVPLPCVVDGAVRFEARNINGDIVVIRGAGLDVRAVGEARYIERFRGGS